jgi:hypothetical protein
MRLPDESRTTQALGDLLIETPAGWVPVRELAEVTETNGPNQILRENGSRRMIVLANTDGQVDMAPVAAHEPGIGPNGGMRVDAAPCRVELVPARTIVNVNVTLDADNSVVDTCTMTGAAILLIDGKPVRVPLSPAAPGVLSANTGVTVPVGVKGAVQLARQDGTTIQAKF